MAEFNHNGHNYRIRKMNAIEQWHLNRKVAPLIPPLVPVFLKLNRSGALTKDLEGVAELLVPFADGLAGMSDEASEFILNTCLSALTREVVSGNTTTWVKVWSVSGKISQFDEINDLTVALALVGKVVWEVLGPFISGLLTAQQSEEPAAAKE